MVDNLQEKSEVCPEHVVAAMQNGIETLELYCLVDMPSRTLLCQDVSDGIPTLVPCERLEQLPYNVFSTAASAEVRLRECSVVNSRTARIKICPITVTGVRIFTIHPTPSGIVLSYNIDLNHPVVMLSPETSAQTSDTTLRPLMSRGNIRH